MRKQKKEEEKKILEELDAAVAEEKREADAPREVAEKKKGLFSDKTPSVIHCKRCKTAMENGVCPTCGFRMYVPMDEKKKKTIRWIVGGVCLVGFLVIFLLTR